MVCPGVSSASSSTVFPTFMTSPALKPRDIFAILSLAVLCAKVFAPGLLHHGGVAAGVVAMFVSIQDLRDVPALRLGGVHALFMIQRIDGERFAGFRARDEIVEVAIGVSGPDLFDD